MCADPECFQKGGLGRGELRGGWGRVNVLNVNIHIYQRKNIHAQTFLICLLCFSTVFIYKCFSFALFYEFDFLKYKRGGRYTTA